MNPPRQDPERPAYFQCNPGPHTCAGALELMGKVVPMSVVPPLPKCSGRDYCQCYVTCEPPLP